MNQDIRSRVNPNQVLIASWIHMNFHEGRIEDCKNDSCRAAMIIIEKYYKIVPPTLENWLDQQEKDRHGIA